MKRMLLFISALQEEKLRMLETKEETLLIKLLSSS